MGLAVGTGKHQQNENGDLYHVQPGCPSHDPGSKGWFYQVPSKLASQSCPPGDIRGTALLPCHSPDAVLPHMFQKTYVVPWDQTRLEA